MKQQGKAPFFTLNFLKMKGRREKYVFARGGYQWKGGRNKERLNEGKCGGCVLYP
jgi:hypothetical protein